MSGLSPDERAVLLDALLPHAWEYPDSFDECGAFVSSQRTYALHLREQVAPVVERIIAARVTAALLDAANDPALRLGGHSGISIRRLCERAAAIPTDPTHPRRC